MHKYYNLYCLIDNVLFVYSLTMDDNFTEVFDKDLSKVTVNYPTGCETVAKYLTNPDEIQKIIPINVYNNLIFIPSMFNAVGEIEFG